MLAIAVASCPSAVRAVLGLGNANSLLGCCCASGRAGVLTAVAVSVQAEEAKQLRCSKSASLERPPVGRLADRAPPAAIPSPPRSCSARAACSDEHQQRSAEDRPRGQY